MMIRLVHIAALGMFLCACGSDPEEGPAPGQPTAGAVGVNAVETEPLGLNTDLTRQMVASAVCTRGNSFARISVKPDGRTNGELLDTKAPLSGTMTPRDPKTVIFEIQTGTVRGEVVGEAMQITTDGQRVLLTGTTFVCRGVEVHLAQG